MEQSAFEAVMTGVNVFVFMIALTASILLMSNVMDMVNYANENAIVGMNGSLAESIGVVNERIYTGRQMLTYFRKQVEIQTLNKDQTEYLFSVKLDETGAERELSQFINSEALKNYLNEKFVLQYKGKAQVEEGKKVDHYVFTVYNEEIEI